MEFSNYANRLNSLVNFDTDEKPPAEYIEVLQFTVKQGEMTKNTVQKNKFSQINDKRFYFPNGILSLSYGHQALAEIEEFKKQKGQKIEKYFWEEKEKLHQMEKKALKNVPRLYLYHQMLMLNLKIVNINQKGDFRSLKPSLIKKTTKDLILSGEWMK